MSTKDELIKKIAVELKEFYDEIETVVETIDAEGWLRDPGTPIDPADIRKGDRIRIECSNGTGTVYDSTRGGAHYARGAKYFRLDRPKPKLPTEPGSVIKTQDGEIWTLDRAGVWRYGKAYADPPSYFDDIDWEVVA